MARLPDLLRLVVDRLAESPRQSPWPGSGWCGGPRTATAACCRPSAATGRPSTRRWSGRGWTAPSAGSRLECARSGGSRPRASRSRARPAARPARLGRRPGLWHEPFNYQAGGLFCLNSRLVSNARLIESGVVTPTRQNPSDPSPRRESSARHRTDETPRTWCRRATQPESTSFPIALATRASSFRSSMVATAVISAFPNWPKSEDGLSYSRQVFPSSSS